MHDKFQEISYQLTAANGMIYLWALCALAVVLALIIFFDPFKRKHKSYRYPGSSWRFTFRFNPFGYIFRRLKNVYHNLNNEIESRRRQGGDRDR